MSHEAAYFIQMARRQALRLARMRETTRGYLNRYRDMLSDFTRDRLQDFIPDEIHNLQQDLENAQDNLESNPEYARETSRRIQTYVHGLRRMANATRIQQEQAERERLRVEAEERAAKKSEAMSAFYAAIRKIKNPAVQNFAQDGLKDIRKSVEAGELQTSKSIEAAVAKVVATAEAKATKWKNSAMETAKRESIGDQIAEIKSQINSEDFDATEKKNTLASLDALLGRQEAGETLETIQNSISEIDKAAEEKVVSEDARKMVVKSVVKILRGQGFDITSNSVTLEKQDDRTVVKIVGSKANGRHAEISVTDTGKMRWRFDRYEGMGCMKDIKPLQEDLKKLYINLSDERVIWENPDRIGKDSMDVPNSNMRSR
jgi:hypothetical protein